jgi:hypothetical protein
MVSLLKQSFDLLSKYDYSTGGLGNPWMIVNMLKLFARLGRDDQKYLLVVFSRCSHSHTVHRISSYLYITLEEILQAFGSLTGTEKLLNFGTFLSIFCIFFVHSMPVHRNLERSN